MATSVTVLCSNAKRINIKVTPNTSILQILEQVCSKQNLNHHEYDLVHQRKALELSLSVRFANLSNNALLELRPSQSNRKESMVVVCMQTEGGGRLIHNFSPSSSLWDILSHWVQEKGLEFLQANAGENAEPVCLYMRKEVIGEQCLKETTLRSLGLTAGNAVIRLFYRVPETLKSQAFVEALQIKPKLENVPVQEVITSETPDHSQKPEVAAPEIVSEAIVDHNSNPEQKSPQDVDMEDVTKDASEQLKEEISHNVKPFSSTSSDEDYLKPKLEDTVCVPNQSTNEEDMLEESDEIIYVGDNHAVLYSAKHIASHVTENLPDDFFELTVEDARYLYATLQKQRKDMENETLSTHSYKESQKLEKMLRFKNSILRLQFPNQLVLQAKFSPLAKISTVIAFVRQFLADEKVDFYLFTTPPKVILNPDHALYEVGLVPASLVYLGSNGRSGLLLKPEVLCKISSHRAACEAAALIRKTCNATYIGENAVPMQSEVVPSSQQESRSQVQQREGQQTTKPSTSSKVPKWFKGSK